MDAVEAPPHTTLTMVRPRGRFVNNNQRSLINFNKACRNDKCGCDDEDCLERIVEHIEHDSINGVGNFINEVETTIKITSDGTGFAYR